MTITIPTNNGTVTVAEPQVLAVLRRADESAMRLAETLKAMGFLPENGEGQQEAFPAGFLLELSAVLQLAAWEHKDQHHHIDAGLPTFEDAAAHLARRAETAPADFNQLSSATLHRQVLSFCLEKIAWQGLDYLGTDVLVGEIDDEVFLDGLAEFLWANRHQLSDQVTSRENQS
jgi:hypothetical protein